MADEESDGIPRAMKRELTAGERSGILEHRVEVAERKLNEGARTFGVIRDDIVRAHERTLGTVKEEAARLERRLSEQVSAIDLKVLEIKKQPLTLQLPAVIAIVIACIGPVATGAWFASEYPKRAEFEQLRRDNEAQTRKLDLMERDILGLRERLGPVVK